MYNNQSTKTVLVAGEGKSVFSIAVCLCKAEDTVYFLTDDVQYAEKQIAQHLSTINNSEIVKEVKEKLKIVSNFSDIQKVDLAIAFTNEFEVEKKKVISLLEDNLLENVLIGINTECIPLDVLQKNAIKPQRILGVNWVEPAYSTFFLELIFNENMPLDVASSFLAYVNNNWDKDGYMVNSNLGIRSKLFSAMVREALYLVENEFASIEDIDRACRNDAGYYMPFAGNLRYMDLMGTKSYGTVMKELNLELNNDESLPNFLKRMEENNENGMSTNKGFYTYKDRSMKQWTKLVNIFSLEIQNLMRSYPFEKKE